MKWEKVEKTFDEIQLYFETSVCGWHDYTYVLLERGGSNIRIFLREDGPEELTQDDKEMIIKHLTDIYLVLNE